MKNNPNELCTKYQELIKIEPDLRKLIGKDSDILKRLYAVVTDLYVDWERAKNSRRYWNYSYYL